MKPLKRWQYKLETSGGVGLIPKEISLQFWVSKLAQIVQKNDLNGFNRWWRQWFADWEHLFTESHHVNQARQYNEQTLSTSNSSQVFPRCNTWNFPLSMPDERNVEREGFLRIRNPKNFVETAEAQIVNFHGLTLSKCANGKDSYVFVWKSSSYPHATVTCLFIR